jgi:hypothetical protein
MYDRSPSGEALGSPTREQCASAASDLLGRIRNLAARGIGYIEAPGGSLEGLLARHYPDAEFVAICRAVDIWETTYLLALNGVDAIVEFMRPRSLAPFLTALDPRSQNLFLERYVIELRKAYPTESSGAVLLRFQ